jgi:hypothetical protein
VDGRKGLNENIIFCRSIMIFRKRPIAYFDVRLNLERPSIIKDKSSRNYKIQIWRSLISLIILKKEIEPMCRNEA